MTPHLPTPDAGADPLGAHELTAAALATWSRSPSRLREDANLEEDAAHGAYRDRVVVELVQNAVDAVRAGGLAHDAAVPADTGLRRGRASTARTAQPLSAALVVVRLGETSLEVANAGRPLDAAGLASMAGMRASTKRAGEGAVGRFGVGFASVRSVADAITVTTLPAPGPGPGPGPAPAPAPPAAAAAAAPALAPAPTAAVAPAREPVAIGFDVGATRRAVAALGNAPLAALLAERDDRLPALRTPHVVPARPLPPGTVTSVHLELRDARARAAVAAQVAALDALTVMALGDGIVLRVEVVGEPERVVEPLAHAIVVRGGGVWDDDELAEAPVEERLRREFAVTWVLGAGGAGVLHAPTPTEEPVTLGATLVATFPLEPGRRHVASGARSVRVREEAARRYVDLVEQVAAGGGDALALVPTGLPGGALDAALHEAVLARLGDVPMLPGADGGRVSPVDAVQLVPTGPGSGLEDDPALLAALGRWVPGLLAAPGAGVRAALRRLGVRTMTLTDAVEEVPAADADLLTALAPCIDARVAEQLAGLRIALRGPGGASGGVAVTPRDVVVGGGGDALGEALAAFAPWGMRVAAPLPPRATEALVRLVAALGAGAGGTAHDAAGLLTHRAVLAAVSDLADAAADLDDDTDVETLDDLTDVLGPELAAAHAAVLTLAAQAAHAGNAHAGTVHAAPLRVVDAQALAPDLPLPSEDGLLVAARDLVVPGAAARVLDGLDVVAPHVRAQVGDGTLAVLGVRTGVVVGMRHDVVATATPLADADDTSDDTPHGWADFCAALAASAGAGGDVELGDVPVVEDLDVMDPATWPEVLTALAHDRAGRHALLVTHRGAGGEAPGYAAWWFRRALGAPFRIPGAEAVLAPETPAELAGLGVDGLDDDVWAAIGGVRTDADLVGAVGDLDSALDLLDALPPIGTPVAPEAARALWAALAAAAQSAATLGGPWPDAPERVVALVPPTGEAGSAGVGSPVTAPDSTVLGLTAPGATAPGATASGATVPDSTAPDSSVPDSTAPDSTAADVAAARMTAPSTTGPRTAAPRTTGPRMAAPRAEVVAAADVVVSDQPALAQIQAVVPAPAGLGGPAGRDASAALADLLDVPEIRADDLTHDVHVEGGSEQRPAGLPAWTLARRVVVDGRDVRWWVDPQGRVSAIDVVSAAQGLAAALGTWHDRLRIEVMLSAPERIVDIAHDDLWG